MTHITYGKKIFCIAALAAAANAFSADADSAAKTAQRCVQIKDIRRTEVIDDQNIVFHMRNKKAYNNHLPQRCNGLTLGNAFRYETSLSQLCNVDIISVVSQTTGEIMPGASCGLGMFELIDPQQTARKN